MEKKTLTQKQKIAILRFCEGGFSDDGFDAFCVDECINYSAAMKFLAEVKAPEQCKGCKHIMALLSYSIDYPCSSCIRLCKDMYEPEDNQ